MKQSNLKKLILLTDFNSEYLSWFDTVTGELTPFQEESNELKAQYKGYYCEEIYGLFNKKKVVFALYSSGNDMFLAIDNKIMKISDKLFINRNTFYPLVFITTIVNNSDTYKFYQWSRDIDEFFMDDFLYFLNYSFLIQFENIKNL